MRKKPDRKLLLALGLIVAAACAAAAPPPQKAAAAKTALKLGAIEKTSQTGVS